MNTLAFVSIPRVLRISLNVELADRHRGLSPPRPKQLQLRCRKRVTFKFLRLLPLNPLKVVRYPSVPTILAWPLDLDQTPGRTCRGEFIQEGLICGGCGRCFTSESSHCHGPHLSLNKIVRPGKVVTPMPDFHLASRPCKLNCLRKSKTMGW